MSNNTGGAAFPCEYFDKQLERPRLVMGMTLRDYFAAKAMQGLMSRVWEINDANELFLVWANSAYAVADAMLKAREA